MAMRISIHAPLTGSDFTCKQVLSNSHDFNPRSPYGERPPKKKERRTSKYFNPRSPYGERPPGLVLDDEKGRFQSTLPLRGATGSVHKIILTDFISIHAPLTGSDLCPRHIFLYPFISIHAPLTGSDRSKLRSNSCLKNFNPRSPYGERLDPSGIRLYNVRISIHAPLTGSDDAYRRKKQSAIISIHAPLTGSDVDLFVQGRKGHLISIHAPLTGSDHHGKTPKKRVNNFNPRSPYGERQPSNVISQRVTDFNPRSPYGERLCRSP